MSTGGKVRRAQGARRRAAADVGGTRRLGSQRWPVEPGTLASRIDGPEVNERQRHRYEVNNFFAPQLEARGYRISAHTPTESLPEMMELPQSGPNAHPWFIGVQFHPEFTSTPRDGHPLFKSYIEAAIANRAARLKKAA